MIRSALILLALAAPAFAQSQQPVPRPEGLTDRPAVAAPVVGQTAPAPMMAEDVRPPSEADRAMVAEQISGAIRSCWNVSGLSPEAQNVRVVVSFEATPEAELIRESIEMVAFENGSQDAADEALGPAFRAIMRCANMGYQGLPPATYPIWQRVQMTFDASAMVNR